MRRIQILTAVLLVLALVALPATALANKQVFKAVIRSDVNTSVRGSMLLSVLPSGPSFNLTVRNLSGVPSAAHIHASDGSVIAWLCGDPVAPVVSCADGWDASTGILTLSADLRPSALVGLNASQFFAALSTGTTYVNIHTAAFPAGEAQGTLVDAN
jgi:hypothetical protein